MAISLPDIDVLTTLFNYNQSTGVLTWKVCRSFKATVGSVVGYESSDGYLHTKINGVAYVVHRIVWKMFYGEDPVGHIDHINCDKKDNRIENLRLVTDALNLRNQGLRRNSTTGYKGVSRLKSRFVARICVNKWQRQLGVFDTAEEAAKAYDIAALALHGDYAKTNHSLGLLN